MLLALYDGAEVLLKPAFGALADRVGPRPVLLAVNWPSPPARPSVRLLRRLERARLHPRPPTWRRAGHPGWIPLLFGLLAGLALASAGWTAAAVPATPPLPRARETLLGLVLTGALIQPRAGRDADAGRLPRPSRYGRRACPGGHRVRCRPDPRAGRAAGRRHRNWCWCRPGHPARLRPPSRAAPAGRLGQTMGAAEVGRELGDVGGPMLVAALASIAGLGARAAGAGGRPTSSLAMRPPDNRRPEPYQLQTLHHRQQPDLRRPSGRRCRQPGAGPVACHLRRVRGRSIISSTTSSLAMVGDQAGAARPPCADVHPPHQLAALLRPLLRPAA